MKIKVFAILKDYLDEEFEISNVKDVNEINKLLIAQKPEIASILNACRYAVGNSFIDVNVQLSENDTIFIIPPSSGG